MAKDTGTGSRKGAITGRTQVKNPATGDYVKRTETVGSPPKSVFMGVTKDGGKFRGVAVEVVKPRKSGPTRERSSVVTVKSGSEIYIVGNSGGGGATYEASEVLNLEEFAERVSRSPIVEEVLREKVEEYLREKRKPAFTKEEMWDDEETAYYQPYFDRIAGEV